MASSGGWGTLGVSPPPPSGVRECISKNAIHKPEEFVSCLLFLTCVALGKWLLLSGLGFILCLYRVRELGYTPQGPFPAATRLG